MLPSPRPSAPPPIQPPAAPPEQPPFFLLAASVPSPLLHVSLAGCAILLFVLCLVALRARHQSLIIRRLRQQSRGAVIITKCITSNPMQTVWQVENPDGPAGVAVPLDDAVSTLAHADIARADEAHAEL